MIWIDDGTEEGIRAFTDRGIECLQELLADIRTWDGGIREVSGKGTPWVKSASGLE